MTHLTDQDLLTATEEHPHVRVCRECRDMLAELRTFTRTLRSDRVWQKDEPDLPPSPSTIPLLEITARLEEEEEEARPAIHAIQSDPARAADIVARFPPTAGLVHATIAAARALLDSNPEQGYHLTVVAEQLASCVNWDGYPSVIAAEHRGRLLKERASALRLLGRHQEALRAIAAARREYESTIAAAHALAILDYVEGTCLREQGRLAEARERAASAAATFADYGDETRLLHCRVLEGVIAAASGEVREARALFLELLHAAAGDPAVRAQLHNNIGQLSIELGELELAATHLLQALRLYRQLGMVTEEIRTNWGLARLLVRLGRMELSVARFEEAEAAFLRVGMHVEAALVALDRIEMLLAVDENASASEECRRIYERLRLAGLATNALAALAYLTESLHRPGPAAAVGRVRSYLERLQSEPALLFLPVP